MYLLIDTSTQDGTVGLWDKGTLAHVRSWLSPHNHTAELMPAIDRMFIEARLSPACLTGIGVAAGPGGFSALRAGLAVAKGISLARGIPLVGIGTLTAAAFLFRQEAKVVCTMINAGRSAVAWAVFTGDGTTWRQRWKTRVSSIDEALAECSPGTIFVGEAASINTVAIHQAGGTVRELPATGRLQGLGELAAARLQAGDTDAAVSLEPVYARPPTIGQPKNAQGILRG